VSALCAVAAILLGGAGLAAAAFPERAAGVCDRLLRAMSALVFGLGAWSAGYAASLLAFGAADRVRLVKDVAVALCGVALIAARRRRAAPRYAPGSGDEAPRWLVGVFVVACAVFCLVFAEHSIREPEGGFDAWMLWNSRARFLARAGDDFRVAFSPRLLFWTHQDYPWLLPGLVAQGFLITGTESPVIPAALGLVFGAATIAIVTCSLARLQGPRAALVGALALSSLPCFATFAASQQADVPLAAFVALAAALVAMAVDDPRKPLRPLLLAGFAAGLGAWTKNDGLVYLVCIAAALLFRLRDIRAAGIFVLGSAPALALLCAFKLGLSPPNDFLLFTTRADLLARFLDARRWVEVIGLALRQVVYFQDFALWASAAAVLTVIVRRNLRADPAPSVLGIAVLLALGCFGAIYLLQPHALKWMFWSSASRLFMQMWPAAILAIVAAVPWKRTDIALEDLEGDVRRQQSQER
jgi:dolichyl-phosphate-mannose-protein mannosyltransferase